MSAFKVRVAGAAALVCRVAGVPLRDQGGSCGAGGTSLLFPFAELLASRARFARRPQQNRRVS